jgi:hypothetical protein
LSRFTAAPCKESLSGELSYDLQPTFAIVLVEIASVSIPVVVGMVYV